MTPHLLNQSLVDGRQTEAHLSLWEERRLESLAAYGLADSQHASRVASRLNQDVIDASRQTGVRFAAVNLIGATAQHTIAGTAGVCLGTIDRDQSICGRMLYLSPDRDVFITGDASLDPDLWDHPCVSGETARIRFYAGASLIGREGLPLGMVCVFSSEPLSHLEAERAGARLLPIRDGIVAILEQHRDAGCRPADQSVTNPYLSAGLLQLVAAPRRAVIDCVIDDATVRTVFQPIVHLQTGTIAGFEALTRGPAGTALESPIALLDAARAAGRLGELDWLCRASALRAAARSALPSGLSWFINVEPAGLEIECPRHLRPTLDHARAELHVVLEVVERGVEDHVTRLLHATDQARRDAWGVALDDVGAQAGSLALLPFLQPDVVKLDMSLLRDGPSTRTGDITAAVRAYAERTGAVILAEGIETEEQAELAEIFGATYGQGYLYGRPGELPSSVPTPTRPIPLRQKPAPIEGATPFEVLEQRITVQRGRMEHLSHIFVHLLDHCGRAETGAVLLSLFDKYADYQQHQQGLDALAALNALTVCLVRDFSAQPASPRHYVGPLQSGSPLAGESSMFVVSPHFSAALVIRHLPSNDSETPPLVDFIYTHDRAATIAAARACLYHVAPGSVTYPEFCPAVLDNQQSEQTRRSRILTYLAGCLRLAPPPAPASFTGSSESNSVNTAFGQAI